MDTMEKHSIDLSHSFDLNGTDNDEMLRLYLRKAGCSDKIECLSPEERKAFIYDIIKSNKMPGYWVPSTMRASAMPQPQSFQPSSAQTSQAQIISQPMYASVNDNQINATLKSSSSSNSLRSLQQHSSHVPQRFAPATPPSPSTFVTGMKGSKYEISGPTNFRHLDGDMTRDMTRNAFDLNAENNDNVLKKYMIERDIKEQDLSGMRKRDIIRNIVHSHFTWKPHKKKEKVPNEPELKYATISTNFELTPPQTPSEYDQSQPPPITQQTQAQTKFSNFNLVTARFQDPSLFPNPDEIFAQPEVMTSTQQFSNTAPPPPSTIQASNYNRNYSRTDSMYATLPRQREINAVAANESLYATVKPQRKDKPLRVNIPMPPSNINSNYKSLAPPQTPPKPRSSVFTTFPMGNPRQTHNEPMVAAAQNFNNVPRPPPPPTIHSNNVPRPPPPPMSNSGNVPIPPPLPSVSHAGNVPMPPPPPPMLSNSGAAPMPPPPPPPSNNSAAGGDPRDALLESIRNGVALKPAMPPPPPMPPSNSGVPKRLQTDSHAQVNASSAAGDPRDALLESIRNGVALRKVDKKAATISGIKPRPEHKPQTMDFLSELKMGITLRRIKNPADNPYAQDEPHESDA